MALNWIPSINNASMPLNAVIAGNDVNGDVIYVGRAYYQGNTLPAKIIPSRLEAYVSWSGVEIPVNKLEVLCSQNCIWKTCFNHNIPGNAVVCGNSDLGQPIYIGRGHHEGSLTVGRVSSVHRALFIPFGGGERRLENYDVLVLEGGHNWNTGTKPPLYPQVPLPVPLPMPMPMPMPTPPPPYTPSAPPYPAPGPSYTQTITVKPATVYNPTTSISLPQTTYVWMSSSGNYVPPGAVVAGHDTDRSTMYVCRIMHEGIYIPGKAVPSRACAYIAHNGREWTKTSWEVLIGSDQYHWVPTSEHHMPPGAVVGGQSHSREPLFVGRGHYQGVLTPGYISQSNRCLFISYGGHEHRIHRFEVLVNSSEFYRGKHHHHHYHH